MKVLFFVLSAMFIWILSLLLQLEEVYVNTEFTDDPIIRTDVKHDDIITQQDQADASSALGNRTVIAALTIGSNNDNNNNNNNNNHGEKKEDSPHPKYEDDTPFPYCEALSEFLESAGAPPSLSSLIVMPPPATTATATKATTKDDMASNGIFHPDGSLGSKGDSHLSPRRRSVVERYVSHEIARKTWTWLGANTSEADQISIDHDEFQNFVHCYYDYLRSIREALAVQGRNLTHEVIEYEENLRDQSKQMETMKRIINRLNLMDDKTSSMDQQQLLLEEIVVQTGMAKQAQVPIERQVSNWDQVRRWEWVSNPAGWEELSGASTSSLSTKYAERSVATKQYTCDDFYVR